MGYTQVALALRTGGALETEKGQAKQVRRQVGYEWNNKQRPGRAKSLV